MRLFDTKTLIIGGLFAFMAFYITKCTSDRENEQLKTELHKETLRNDTLKKISETQYEKYVADTVTKKDMMKLLKELGVDVKNPKIITRIEYVQKNIEKPIDDIVVKDDKIKIEDFYPNKELKTITYNADIDLKTKKGIGKFTFKPQALDLIVSETKEGLWKATLKTDNEYVEIKSLDVQSLPLPKETLNNWGWLGGVKYNTTLNNNYENNKNNVELLGGVRYKKFNVIGSANTNSQIGGGVLIEF